MWDAVGGLVELYVPDKFPIRFHEVELVYVKVFIFSASVELYVDQLVPPFVEYSIVILMPKVKVWHIKCAMLVSTLCWAIYGLVYQNYVMLAFNILSFVITIITLIKIWKNKSNDASEN